MIIKVAVVAAFLHVMWSSGGTGSAIQIFDDDVDDGDDDIDHMQMPMMIMIMAELHNITDTADISVQFFWRSWVKYLTMGKTL